ncbi:hypothetical protein [Leptospira inadai]|uniref:Lipoprotein n=1 Tax=Leptospira inadai serovar Lyme TaxID=293084 RepID=A0ABX4YEV5_9LEPT|nr:hypothetical protein [Leptospira inadai]PNV73404.1 hypothetical protein BES34_017325 [Leptospira inadai serovar Lyme]
MNIFLIFPIIIFLFSGTFGCSSVSVPGGGRFGSELIQEQAILDFYGTEEERISSLKLLRSTCRSIRSDRGLACYNLSVLYQSLGDLDGAIEYAIRAKSANPKDPLYAELAFQTALAKDNRERSDLDQGEISLISAIRACKEGRKDDAYLFLAPLVASGEISKESLSRGLFADCGLDKSFIAEAKSNSIKPSLEYYKTLEKNHPFRKIWDLSGEFGRNQKESSANKATRSWQELRKALPLRDIASAKKHIVSFKQGLEDLSRETPASKQLALHLKKAAYLLLSEDSNFSTFKDLAKELSDRPVQTQ